MMEYAQLLHFPALEDLVVKPLRFGNESDFTRHSHSKQIGNSPAVSALELMSRRWNLCLQDPGRKC